ncbi:ATP-dependent helicase HrpB [Vibrio diazotrophicus]|uniref:ATP-dependent helicase HrpB n=1 Tax=Vibrio diazotrophicus TaxID=685 RepID=A0A2J8I2N9_VIBDI|nr:MULTISPECIES: ATP-dependent helicase HrpB [Vibrio]MCF7363047.1 ATP-dependent helicase HrpB [Vibrio sp. A1-b2]PNI04812.1 ATP-dependent helicase HrpB [Vibrio diazotrophicus]
MSQLPILAVIPDLLAGVEHSPQLILKAAPGAGKSTYFPLALLNSGLVDGKIIMLEPRRLAARNIARYLSQQLGESVGKTVGYRVRGETKVSSDTRLEVVTEGIMTRMIQNDPELDGIGALIFDEFHERSIHADTALALSLEVQSVLRDDLKIIVMSATLDQAALQQLLPLAEYVESQGRGYPIDVRYQPIGVNEPLVPAMAKQIRTLMSNEQGSLLAFLPGAASITALADQLSDLPSDVDVCPIYGQMSFAEQQKAISAAPQGKRKVVLATNIAETSLTIEGIRIVVDSGLERVARFDLKTGITRLEQVRIAQSSAEQRAGRAGRLEAGICVRLYSEAQFNQQPKVSAPEILQSDLAPLMLELAQWGVKNANELQWLDLPPASAMNQASSLLQSLGLMDKQNQLTAMGKEAHRLGVEPRIAAMLLKVENENPALFNSAVALAALLEEPERQILDLQHSLHRWQLGSHPKSKQMAQRANTLANKLDAVFSLSQVKSSLLPLVACLAFPDRIAQKRGQGYGQFLLANGHGAFIDESQPLAGCDYVVALDLMRSLGSSNQISQSSRIFCALDLDIDALESQFGFLFATSENVDWDEKAGRLVAEERCCLGDVVIRRRALPEPDKQKMTQALLNYVERKGLSVLNWSEQTVQWLERVRCGIEWLDDEEWPAMDDASLLSDLREWLEPYLIGITSVKALQKVPLIEALNARLGWPLNQQIDEWLPVDHVLPTGTHKRIRYQCGKEPVLSVRMQEVFGEKTSPVIAKGRQAIVMELLSPAQRPLQVTRDLAGFWAGAYKEVQKEMKGRYPKHVWPDDPANHVATTKTKRQLNS